MFYQNYRGNFLKANKLIEIEEIMKVSTRLAINRSAYKTNFDEINNKIKFLDQKDNILDLGAAPGSWSQFLSKKNYKNILAIDILDIDKINYVEFVKGDFTDENIQSLIKKKFHTPESQILKI